VRQLEQLLAKGIDDEGCAKILNLDVEVVQGLHSQISHGEAPSEHVLTEVEKEQLRELFARNLSPDTCAEILHIDIRMALDFQASERASALAEQDLLHSAKRRALQALVLVRNGKEALLEASTKPWFQVSAASAALGSAACGTAGGCAGTMVGGAVGAGVGLVPAVFTLGLSIPIAASLGSGIGLCVGAATGASCGALAGGVSGYIGFAYRNEVTSLTGFGGGDMPEHTIDGLKKPA